MAGYTSQQDFLVDTVRLIDQLEGYLDNYHCRAAVEALTTTKSVTTNSATKTANIIRLPDYFYPDSAVIEDWYIELQQGLIEVQQLLDRKLQLDDKQVVYQLSSSMSRYYDAANVIFKINQSIQLQDKTIFQCLQFINTVLDEIPDMDDKQLFLTVILCLKLACWLNQELSDFRLEYLLSEVIYLATHSKMC